MTEPNKPKGMSKGCLIGIIIAVVLIIIIFIGIFYIMKNKSELAKYSIASVVSEAKVQLANVPEPYIDTVIFNRVVDAFTEKLKYDTLDIEAGEGAPMLVAIQSMGMSPKYDSATFVTLFDSMIKMYPELEDVAEQTAITRMEEAEEAASIMIDSMNVDSMMQESDGQ